MNCVSCAAWVKRGGARAHPDKVKLTEDELSQLIQKMKASDDGVEGDDDDDDDEDVNGTDETVMPDSEKTDSRKRKRPTLDTVKKEIENDDAAVADGDSDDDDDDDDDIGHKYDMSDYDDTDDEDTGQLKMSGITTFVNDRDDPLLKADEQDSDDEDMQILPDDNLLAIGKVKRDLCCLEVFVYNEKEDNCWCHHDIILPTFPLAMEWINYDPSGETSGNFIAMGTMAPDIEIWDLDVVDTLEPAFILAGAEKKKSKKKKIKKSASGHTDAVLDLSWNKLQKNVLASASADFTIGLWDLSQGTMVSSIEHHKEKVQTLQWHPFEPQSLVSGSFDKTTKIYDCRSPKDIVKSWKLPGEVERVTWNHMDPYYFLASSDNGHVYYLDVRAAEPVFTLKAHTNAVSGLTLSSSVPNCLITASADNEMKVWDIKNNKPTLVFSKDLKIGELHFAVPSPDSGLIFTIGGESDFRVMNLHKNKSITDHFNVSSEGTAYGPDDSEEVPITGGVDEDETDEETTAVEKDISVKKKKKKKKDKGKKKT